MNNFETQKKKRKTKEEENKLRNLNCLYKKTLIIKLKVLKIFLIGVPRHKRHKRFTFDLIQAFSELNVNKTV